MQTQNAGSQTVQPQNAQQPAGGSVPKFCPECGTPTNGAKFCPECGKKLQ
jgi:membrane protease subunit (stomatin/prohibitin family)